MSASPDLVSVRINVANTCGLLVHLAPERAEVLLRRAFEVLAALDREGRLPPEQFKPYEWLRGVFSEDGS